MKISKPNEPIEAGVLPDDDEIVLSELSATYLQHADNCDSDPAGFQELKISTQDGGAGFFLIIQTERWAIDTAAQSIEPIIADFKSRLGKLKSEK